MSGVKDRAVNVTEGRLLKPLLVLALPIVASQMLNVAYNLADTYWVGQIGAAAVAATSFSWAIIFLMVSVGGGLTVAGTVLVAQNKGGGTVGESHHVAGQTVSFVTLVALVFAVLGYVLTPTLMALVGAEPGTTAYSYAVSYTRTIFLGVPFMFWFFIFDAISRGWGDTKTPLYLMLVSVVLNVILDPFLIFGFSANPLFAWFGLADLQVSLYTMTGFSGFGIQGAAIATAFSRVVAGSIGMFLLFSGRVGLSPTLSDLWLRVKTVRKILDVGVPSAAEQGLRGLGITVLTAIIALAGTEAVAAYGIVTKLTSLMFLPALGLARGTEAVVGQNLGADQIERAKHAVYLSAGLIAAVFIVVITLAYPFAEEIVGIFIQGENAARVIELGAAYVKIAGPAFVFLGVFQITLSGFRGSGSTRLAMVFSIQELWLFRIPIACIALMWLDTGVVGVWYAIAIAFVASAITTGAWFFRGTWTDNVLDADDTPSLDTPVENSAADD
jgi:putative MATE family efflux protein